MTELEDNLFKARNAVFQLLKVRLRSEKEIIERLKKKKFEDSLIEETCKYFRDIELIDDRKFAQEWIHSRLNKPFGLNRIKRELIDKGIAKDILEDELKKVDHKNDGELDIIQKLVQKRFQGYGHIDKNKLKQRIFGYLIRRGFSSENTYKALKEL